MLHELPLKAMEFATRQGWNTYTLVSPGLLTQADLDVLLSHPALVQIWVAGLENGSERVSAYAVGAPLKARGHVLLLASDALLTKWIVSAALKSGQWGVYCLNGDSFRFVPFYKFAMWRVGDLLIDRLNGGGGKSLFHRIASWVYDRPKLRNIVKMLLRRPAPLPPSQASRTAINEMVVQQQLTKIIAEIVAHAPRDMHVPGRVVLINAGLGAGGAERQVVNTLLGLHARGVDVSFLGEYLFGHADLAFFHPMLVAAGVPSRQVERKYSLTKGDLASISPALVAMHLLLPSHLIEEMANLVLEFRAIKPEVVHAWQDSTSIKAAIAALIAGVPRILVSSRNMTPPNFAYHAEYMRPAYQALAQVKDIVFINNSEAGAQDYCKWLGLPRGRYQVVRNGVNFNKLRRCNQDEQQAFRSKYNLPANAPLMGAIFRFWAEKRPLLWLEAAALLAADLPEHHFVLAGDGPMRDEMTGYLRSLAANVRHRIHLIEPQKDISPLLSTLEIFFMTSAFEGTPNVALEAQWCGAPVVATKAGGTAEAVFSGQTGLIVGVATAAELAAAVLRVHNDQLYKARTIKNAQDLLTQRFGFERMLDETIACYGWNEAATPAQDEALTA